MQNTSRHWIVDWVELIGNSIAICSHLQENLNSYWKNEEITEADAELCKEQIDVYTWIRREIMKRISEDFTWNNHYWCALKHAIAVWTYATEIAYANKDDWHLRWLQQFASDSMYSILSMFINQEITTCGRCLNDSILPST
jgi:hypothetical protein